MMYQCMNVCIKSCDLPQARRPRPQIVLLLHIGCCIIRGRDDKAFYDVHWTLCRYGTQCASAPAVRFTSPYYVLQVSNNAYTNGSCDPNDTGTCRLHNLRLPTQV